MPAKLSDVYIVSTGSYLPGDPVGNDDIEKYLGVVEGRSKRIKKKILKSNGIEKRYYALDLNGKPTHLCDEMSALSVDAALAGSDYSVADIEMLSVGTTISDVLAPGIASLVHGRLGNRNMEILSCAGICGAGIAAVKAAYHAIQTGQHSVAVASAVEKSSASLRASRFEKEVVECSERDDPDEFKYFNAEFLRWMLSDGAGSMVLANQAASNSVSLKVDWVETLSYANELDTCMYAGTSHPSQISPDNVWTSKDTASEADNAGLFLLRQNTSLLGNNIIQIVVRTMSQLIAKGRLKPRNIDLFLPHISSMFFKEKLMSGMKLIAANIPEEKWYTNLTTKGNTGAASIFIMLDEALKEGKIKAGDKVLLFVPESGRFSASFMQVTAVAPTGIKPNKQNSRVNTMNYSLPQLNHSAGDAELYEQSPIGERLNILNSPIQNWLGKALAMVWYDFEKQIDQTAFVKSVNEGTITLEGYKTWLYNMRQQVKDGARWITRAASNLDEHHAVLREAVIGHAFAEKADYRMLEQNFKDVGGDIELIQQGLPNVGTEALSAFVLNTASQPNPVPLFGAVFIIEGLGSKIAGPWAKKIQETLGITEEQTSFLSYHSDNDEDHYKALIAILCSPFITAEIAVRLVKVAKVVARLYALQLEEMEAIPTES